MDPALDHATKLVRASLRTSIKAEIRSFFDEPTNTASYVAWDPATKRAAIIDSVLDFDSAAGRTDTASADAIIAFVKAEGLTIDWLLETHAHADHLSAAPYLQKALGGKIAIEFDHLFDDGDRFTIGEIDAVALHVPGHTPADLAYVVGDAVFTGDTLFMPDYGTARADFPGGDARELFRSIRRLLKLPPETRLFLCHDYKAAGRDKYVWETTVEAQRTGNVHVHEGVDEDDFVSMRTKRDATLSMPKLIFPSIQVNMRGGHLPEAEPNGTRYLKIPLDVL